jgi:hypothetical protein
MNGIFGMMKDPFAVTVASPVCDACMVPIRQGKKPIACFRCLFCLVAFLQKQGVCLA